MIPLKSNKNSPLSINKNGDYFILSAEDIEFIKADGSYSIVTISCGKEIIISKSLKNVERILRNENFFRCHHSYLVNLKRIDCFQTKIKKIIINGKQIPVSRRKFHALRGLLIHSINHL
jgi:two-component system LytT family response regulator